MALLKGAANTFMFNEDLSNDEIIKITKNIQKLTEFDRVFLVKKNGEAVFSTGDIINISDRDYFKNITKAKNEIAETRGGVFDKDTNLVITSVPIMKDNEVQGAVCGTYKISTFSSAVSNSVKDENGFVLLLNGAQEFILNFSTKDRDR